MAHIAGLRLRDEVDELVRGQPRFWHLFFLSIAATQAYLSGWAYRQAKGAAGVQVRCVGTAAANIVMA